MRKQRLTVIAPRFSNQTPLAAQEENMLAKRAGLTSSVRARLPRTYVPWSCLSWSGITCVPGAQVPGLSTSAWRMLPSIARCRHHGISVHGGVVSAIVVPPSFVSNPRTGLSATYMRGTGVRWVSAGARRAASGAKANVPEVPSFTGIRSVDACTL